MSTPLPRPAEEFLSWLEVERGRSPRTLSSYRRDLAAYEEALGASGVTMAEAAAADVAAYLARLRRTHSAASVARALSSMRGFHRFLVEEGLREDDPTVDLPSISVTDLLPKALSEEETEQLLGRRGGDRPAGAARPRAARGALRHRRPGERGGRPQPGRRGRGGGGQRPAAAARARQGGQGAGRAARAAAPATPWPTGCRPRAAR